MIHCLRFIEFNEPSLNSSHHLIHLDAFPLRRDEPPLRLLGLQHIIQIVVIVLEVLRLEGLSCLTLPQPIQHMQLLVTQHHILVVKFITNHTPPIFVLTLLQELRDLILECCLTVYFIQILIISNEILILILLRLESTDLTKYL